MDSFRPSDHSSWPGALRSPQAEVCWLQAGSCLLRCGQDNIHPRSELMRVGVFTALLGQLSLDEVIRKLRALGVKTVELGTGNYPGDPHCKLAMLEGAAAFKE